MASDSAHRCLVKAKNKQKIEWIPWNVSVNFAWTILNIKISQMKININFLGHGGRHSIASLAPLGATNTANKTNWVPCFALCVSFTCLVYIYFPLLYINSLIYHVSYLYSQGSWVSGSWFLKSAKFSVSFSVLRSHQM